MAERYTFVDRAEAGRALGVVVADHLAGTDRPGRPIVLALPRGGVPVGCSVAMAIDADLDVIVARKIGLPSQPEFGIGAVTENGPPYLDWPTLRRLGFDHAQLEPLIQHERAEVRRRLRLYRGDRPRPDLAGRTVVIVDDGLATGVTARAALASVRAEGPAYLVFAAPVCAADSAMALRGAADAVLTVLAPAALRAVGLWYDDFAQLSDADVVRWLAAAWDGSRRAPQV
jgi:putative phosphoribosyl transferase